MSTHIDGVDEKVPMITTTFTDTYFIKQRQNSEFSNDSPCDVLKGEDIQNAVPVMTFLQVFENLCDSKTPSEITFSDPSGTLPILRLNKNDDNSYIGIIEYSVPQQNFPYPMQQPMGKIIQHPIEQTIPYPGEYHPQIDPNGSSDLPFSINDKETIPYNQIILKFDRDCCDDKMKFEAIPFIKSNNEVSIDS